MSHDALRAVRLAAVSAISAAPELFPAISGIFDGPPPRAPFPYVSIDDGPATDWSTKTETGREIRLALTVWDDGEVPDRLNRLTEQVEQAIRTMAPDLGAWRIASLVHLRTFIVRNPARPWAGLVEHRVRVLRNHTQPDR